MRQTIVAGNWKMNKTISEAVQLAMDLHNYSPDFPQTVEVLVAPPSLYLANIQLLEHPTYKLAAQNCSHHDYGAFTGEHSAAMLHEMNVPYCIIGHSERRQYFHESPEMIARKLDACLRNNVHPIFCCGEVLEDRNANQHFVTILHQLEHSLFHLESNEMKNVIVAYEPVWAIGTGVTASAEQAQEMHAFIREQLAIHFGQPASEEISILYGGSVSASNSAELFAMPDVDGGLVGGASLKAKDFTAIIKNAA
ncbi:MAG: triose-phosphate isomerase [Flavobacteriales bacterium]